MDEAAEALVAGAVSLVNAFNPCRLILGGGVIEGTPELVDRIREGVHSSALMTAIGRLEIIPARLREDAGLAGAILVPDAPTIQQAFFEQGRMDFPLEVTAGGVSSDSPYFASNQPRHVVGFPPYTVLLYNTTDKAVHDDLYAYLRTLPGRPIAAGVFWRGGD